MWVCDTVCIWYNVCRCSISEISARNPTKTNILTVPVIYWCWIFLGVNRWTHAFAIFYDLHNSCISSTDLSQTSDSVSPWLKMMQFTFLCKSFIRWRCYVACFTIYAIVLFQELINGFSSNSETVNPWYEPILFTFSCQSSNRGLCNVNFFPIPAIILSLELMFEVSSNFRF